MEVEAREGAKEKERDLTVMSNPFSYLDNAYFIMHNEELTIDN